MHEPPSLEATAPLPPIRPGVRKSDDSNFEATEKNGFLLASAYQGLRVFMTSRARSV